MGQRQVGRTARVKRVVNTFPREKAFLEKHKIKGPSLGAGWRKIPTLRQGWM